MWKKVDDAVKQGLPKSALEALEPILQKALSEKDYPDAVRAFAKRSLLQSQIEGGDPLIAIKQLKGELETAPDALRQPLQAILGHWYWTYFQQNRWRFANRSQTASPPSEDIATWDLKRLFDEIDRTFAAALTPAEATQKIPIASYDAMLTSTDFPDSYRPTLYDFLAHTAIDFYAAGEQAGVQSFDAFVLDADSPALGSAGEFLAWKAETTDDQSPYYKAISLYQALMQFHAQDADPSARLDADLDRLQFVHAHAVGEEKTNRTLAALKRFAETNASHPLSALARHRWASLLRNDNHMVDAHAIATQGKNAFPESIGGRLCSQLIADIEGKSLDVQSERVWNAPWLKLRVQYRNVTQAHFRIVRADWRSRFTRQRWHSDQFLPDELAKLKQSPTVAAWSVDLPATDDYLPSTHDVDVPKDLPPGFYIVLYSNRKDFAVGEAVENVIGAVTAWVSKLAIVTQTDWSHSGIRGLVVDNQSGAPIAGANVRALHRDNNTGIMQDGASVTTDANGAFKFEATPNNSFLLATHDGHSLSTAREFSSYPQQSPEPRPQVVFFTDRAIYRRGQRVQFKGIAMILDAKKNRYEVIKNTPTNVELIGPNGQVVETLELRTNEFGSFAGTFSAPRNAGTGMMHIRASAFEGSIAHIRVEEYKRPKFYVEVESPKDTPRL
ncbi:MAG: MG2 domain-containing protein, partial [Pirellula sp.]